MKKLLLLLAGCLFAGSAAFAQSETETPTPGWTVRLNITEPTNVVKDATYEMEKTDVQIGESYVYTYTVTVLVDPSKSSKYYIYVYYTDENGDVKSKNTAALYQTYNDGAIDITVSAFLDSKGEIQYILSNSKYLLCDTNWTGIGYFDASKTGLTNEIYFNNTQQKGYVAVRNLGAATAEYVPGGNTQYQSNLSIVNNPGAQNGLFKASFDYSNMTLSFDKVNSLTLEVEDFIPFVSASPATLPDGLTAYVYSSYDNGEITMETLEGNVVPANTPVLLKGTEGFYTITLSDDYSYIYALETTGTRNYLSDSNVEGSLLYGVHQPHLVPANGYTFKNGSFTKASASDIITALDCYFKIDETDAPDSLTIVFPEEEEEEPDNWDFTFSNDTDQFSPSDSDEDGVNGNISLFTEDKDASSISFTVNAPSGIEMVYYAWVPATDNNGDSEDEEDNDATENAAMGIAEVNNDSSDLDYQEATKVADSDVNAFSINLPFTGNSTKGSLYIATKDSESAAYAVKGTYNVSITRNVETGVESVVMSSVNDNAIYNVFGQKVDETYKGIVIKNGKKYIQR